MIGPRGIAPMAQRQLAAWQEIAASWGFTAAERDGQSVIVCGECGMGMWLATDRAGSAYTYTEAEKQAHIVLHLRTRHPGMEPPG
jgi:hypothetical protein